MHVLKARHTLVVSDIHLTEAEAPHPHLPLWKRYKRAEYFVDAAFGAWLQNMQKSCEGPIELVLNGDIFDFDAVMARPNDDRFPVSWVEKARGLSPEEPKSLFKMERILADHSLWCRTMGDFVRAGHRVVFVIGNHDLEVHWPAVQNAIIDAFKISPEERQNVIFTEWFFISNGDTLIEHGNQYDSYCMCTNPLFPTIRKNKKDLIRLPFGNLANKFMLNGMGLFNPHVQTGYIMGFREYMVFFFKYIIRTQPFLLWTWFWGACCTLAYSLHEGLLPASRDPLSVEDRVEKIAAHSNATPRIVRQLYEIRAHPASHDPLRILRELWLDRFFLFFLILYVGFNLYTFFNALVPISMWWMLLPIAVLMPFFLFYARSIQSPLTAYEQAPDEAIALSSHISGVARVVHGHTHSEAHMKVRNIELLNTGSWSPAFEDLECTRPYGIKPFAWIKPAPQADTSIEGAAASASDGRVAELWQWTESGPERCPSAF